MKAIVQLRYGSPSVLELQEVEMPKPRNGQVLVRVHAASVNPADWAALTGKPYLVRLMGFGLFKPRHRILGMDVAGRVEAVGRNVTQFQPGDEVFGDLSGCGLGAFAEYVAVPQESIAPKPANLTFEEAAALPHAAANEPARAIVSSLRACMSRPPDSSK
jgi:NADPH:quinone reductase-like Zn-dependent oxidoreductase